MSGPGVNDWTTPAAPPAASQGQDDWTGPTLAAPAPAPREDLGYGPGVYKPKTSALGSAAHAAERGVAPAVTGLGVGVGTGEAVTAATAPFLGPWSLAAGTLAGLGAGYLGAEKTQEAEDWALKKLPYSVQNFLGQSEPQQAADEAQHPYASLLGNLIPNLALLRPGAVAQDVAQGAGAFTRTLASPVGQRALGATLGGGQEAASEESQTGQIDPVKVGMAATAGALMNKPTRLGRAIMDGATAPQRVLTNIATGKPADAPPPTAQGPDDWASEGATAAASPPTQPGMPGHGEAVGLRFKSGPPQRGTVDHYFDNGNAVRLRMDDGSTHDLTTADLMSNRTEPPAPIQPQGPATKGPTLDMDAAPFPEDWANEPYERPAAPQPAPLGGDMLRALDHADSMEKMALNGSLNLSAAARQDMLTESARLRRQFGRGDEEPPSTFRPTPPTRLGDLPLGQEGDYAHPLAGEPAADLGALGAARAANPALYEGERVVPPPDVSRETAPTVDPYAMEDVMRARAPMPKDQTLFDAIRAMGGIKDVGGDVNQIMAGYKNPRFQKRLVNPNGLDPDQVRANLQEDGWFGKFEDQYGPDAQEVGSYPGDDTRDLYDLMDREARGQPVYHPESQVPAELESRRLLDEDFGRAGIGANDSNEVAAQKLTDYRQTELAEQDAFDRSRATHQEISPEAEQELESHGYEPGTDFGAELEDAGSRKEGAGGPEDWLREPERIDESDEQPPGPEQALAEEHPVEREDSGRGVEDWTTTPGAIATEHEAEMSNIDAEGASAAEEGLPHTQLATEPGAVDARGRPVDQTILPGAEHSAQQLAEAREASGHGRIRPTAAQKEPGGLFEEPDAQTRLFEQPGPHAFAATDNEFKDLAPEFAEWMRQADRPTDNLGISDGLRDYLLERGKATGHEALATHNPITGGVSHVETSGNSNMVQFSEDAARALMDPEARFISHHNHPNSRSLSPADIGTLAFPGLRWVVVHGHDGNWYAARLSPRWRAQIEKAGSNTEVEANIKYIKAAAQALRDRLMPYFSDAIVNGRISAPEATDAWGHTAVSALARAGHIEYLTSKELSPNANSVAEDALAKSAKGSIDRQPGAVGFQDGIGRILDSVSGQSASDSAGRGEAGSEVPGGPKVEQDTGTLPESVNEAADRQDSAAEEMADSLKAAPPGTYRRTLSKMTPPSGDMIFKDPNAVQNVTMRPETLARMDTRSGAIWNAEKAKEYDANSMLDDLRQRISDTMLKLNDTQRRNVYAARELDRINGRTRVDTGHQIVARNDGADFAHFSKPGQVVTLTPQETAAYHSLTDMFDRSWKNVMEGAARKVGYAGAWDKDDMAKNLQELASAAQQGVDKGSRDTANRALKIVGALDEQRRQGYHPLMRFGDYFAHVTPKYGQDQSSTGGFPKSLHFELAERGLKDDIFGGQRIGNQSPPYAKEMLDRLQAKYPADKFNIEHGYLAKNPDMLDRVDIPAVEKLMTFMENDMLHSMRGEARGRGLSKEDAKADAQKRYDDLYGATVDKLWEKTFKELESGYKKKSGTIPGYSNDFDRALGTYMHWTSRNVADQINRNSIDEAHTAMETDPRVNSAVKQYWRDWRDYQTRPSNIFNKSVNGMARWGFLTAMGMNPSSTAVVGAHGLFMAGPTLSVGVGMNKAAPAFAKAMTHALGAIKVDQTGLHIDDVTAAGRTPGEKALLKDMDAQGILHSRAIEDMSALNEKQSDLWGNAKSSARKFMDMALSNVSVMDRANRIASALSAYRLGQDPKTLAAMDKAWSGNQIWRDRRTTDGLTAENMARFMAPNMVGEYGPMNRAPIERNAATKMMMGMHGFVTRLLSKMWQLGTMGPQGQQALLWTMGAFWTMAGLNGIPFTQDAQNAADLVWKTATGKDPMLGYRVQAGLASMFGKAGADMLLHGPVSTLGGVDVASRLGLGDLISRNWPTAENTLGAYPSIILGRAKAAAQDVQLGRGPLAAAAEFLPAGPRNVIRAARESQEGVRSGSGRTEVPASKITPLDTAARVAGFTPERVEHAYQRNDFRYRAAHSKMGAPPNPIPQRKGGRTG